MSKEFELARLAMIKAGKEGEIDSARAYAWAYRIYPLSGGELEEVFKNDFQVSRKTVDDILKEIDDASRAGSPIGFYSLEEKFGHGYRMELIHVCRCAFLDRRFQKNDWSALLAPGAGPIESQNINAKFDPKMDLLY